MGMQALRRDAFHALLRRRATMNPGESLAQPPRPTARSSEVIIMGICSRIIVCWSGYTGVFGQNEGLQGVF